MFDSSTGHFSVWARHQNQRNHRPHVEQRRRCNANKNAVQNKSYLLPFESDDSSHCLHANRLHCRWRKRIELNIKWAVVRSCVALFNSIKQHAGGFLRGSGTYQHCSLRCYGKVNEEVYQSRQISATMQTDLPFVCHFHWICFALDCVPLYFWG